MMKKTYWNADLTPVETTLDRIIYELRKETGSLMFDAVTLADIYEDSDGMMPTLDALISPFAKLDLKMSALQKVMERAGGTIQPIKFTISEAFTLRNTANVAVIFELSDGQTVSIFLRNSDVINPKKIVPADDMLSWKWMLNKKDCTVAVAPETGTDLDLRKVAARIMKLAEKNSALFAKGHAKRTEQAKAVEYLKVEVSDLENELKAAQHRLEIAKIEKNDREIAAVTNPVVEPEIVNVDGLGYTPIDLNADSAKQEWEKAISETNGNEFEAARNVYQKIMQGHYVDTPIGKVFISGSGWQEIKSGLKKDSLRAQTVPHIVEILKEGVVGAFDPNKKLDKKPNVTGYYPFTKTVEVDGKLVTALLKVEQKSKGEFVYHLRTSSDSTLDSTHENASLLRFMPDSLAFRELEEPTLDSIVESNTGGVNIIILKVTDLEGNEIKELEDFGDEPEPIEPTGDENSPIEAIEPEIEPTPIEPETNPLQNHIDTLQSVIDGKHDDVELTELLDMIDVAATAIIDAGGADEYDALIGDAATKWADLDQKKNG